MLKITKWKLFSSVITIIFSVYFSIPALVDTSSCRWLPSNKLNYGLDLNGGVSIIIAVNLQEYISEKLNTLAYQFQKQLDTHAIKISHLQVQEKYFTFKYNNKSSNVDLSKYHPLDKQLKCQKLDNTLQCNLRNTYLSRLKQEILEQSMEVIRKRIDSLGNKEIETYFFGNNTILLQVPGLKDPKQVKKLIGQTAKLSFHVVKNNLSRVLTETEKMSLMLNSKILPIQNTGKLALVDRSTILTGNMLSNAFVNYGQMGEPIITFQLNDLGKRLFADFTSKNINEALAIVIDDQIMSTLVIKEPIVGGEAIISGDFTAESASALAISLRTGSLPVPLKIIEEKTIGPTLGSKSIKYGVQSCRIAATLVVVIMLVYYKVCGLVAVFALGLNFITIIALLSILGSILTLPGIAGITLTLGMAVDANILIFERIKEELAIKKSIISSINSGYKYTFMTILDSNITTIFAAMALYVFGTSVVKGFSITLIIGILSSMFTSITVTQIIISLWCHIREPRQLLI